MAIGDPVVFLSADSNGGQKSYRAGEKVGKFELVSFDGRRSRSLGGKTVERRLADLVPKEPVPQPQQNPAAAARPPRRRWRP